MIYNEYQALTPAGYDLYETIYKTAQEQIKSLPDEELRKWANVAHDAISTAVSEQVLIRATLKKRKETTV